jgi:hypothetical protein
MIKGVVLSQLAIVTALIEAKALRKDDLINVLERFTDLISESHPDADLFLEPIRTLKDALSRLPDNDDPSMLKGEAWLSDVIGHA